MKWFVSFVLASILAGCGGSSSDDAASTTDTTTDTTSNDSGDTSGSDSSASTSDVSSESFPSSLAVTSPFERSASTTASLNRATSAVSSSASPAEKQAFYQEILTAATDAACQVFLPSVNQVVGPDCYGPDLDYVNHIDAPNGSTDADSIPTLNGGPGSTDDDGRLPTGDLGIWSASEDGEACSAAKINSLMEDVTRKVDYAMTVAAAMNCVVARDSSLELPESGSSTTLTTALSTALAVNNAGLTVSSATITAGTDSDDNIIYTYDISSGTSDATSVFTIKHVDESTDSDTSGTIEDDEQLYKGKVWGSIEGMAAVGGSGGYGFTMLYNFDGSQSDTDAVKFKLVSGSYVPNESSPNSTSYFDDDGDYITQGEGLGNLVYAVTNMDPTTGLGSVVYSWSAGGGNEESRTFNATVAASGNDTVGYGFFGYGDQFNTTTGAQPDGSIDEFICNWAGPGNSHEGLVSKAQKQVMTYNSTTNVFESTSASITYAPTRTCDFDGSSTNESGGGFDWGVAVATGPDDSSQFGTNFDGPPHAAATNDLVDLTTDTDYLNNYSAPSVPTDPFVIAE